MHTDSPRAPRTSSPRRFAVALFALLLALAPPASSRADTNILTHAELQAVNPDGTSPFVVGDSCPFLLRGILLNDPADMLSTDYVPGAEGRGNGAQYQVFLQGLSPDRGGTVLYMSEGTSGESYTEEEWTSELARVTTDPDTGHLFRPGDYVEITANWAMYRGGKLNVNEAHDKSPAMDFQVRLITPGAGFPPAEPITLADLVDADGVQIFDSTRGTGGEHWQGMRVRLDAVRLANDDAVAVWNHEHPETLAWRDRLVPCTDAAGRTFNLRLPRYSLGPAPATNRWFSATGILNQENSNTAGYELFVQEIGPILDLSFDETDGTSAITYSADYAGYRLQVSDDSGANWTDALAFPSIIVIHDPEASPARFYRLVLPSPAD